MVVGCSFPLDKHEVVLVYLKGYDNTCSLCFDDEIKQINLFYPRDHIYFLGISYSRLNVEENVSEGVMLSILLFLGVTHSVLAVASFMSNRWSRRYILILGSFFVVILDEI